MQVLGGLSVLPVAQAMGSICAALALGATGVCLGNNLPSVAAMRRKAYVAGQRSDDDTLVSVGYMQEHLVAPLHKELNEIEDRVDQVNNTLVKMDQTVKEMAANQAG